MKNYLLTVEFHDWWHASSGEAGLADRDTAVERDADGLILLGGKRLHGLFRDAAILHLAHTPPGSTLCH